LNILYFAWVRERVGVAEEDVAPPPEVATVGALIDWLAARSGGHAAAFSERGRLRAAVDGCFVGPDAPVGYASEVAIFPPVTGGAA